MTFANSPGLPAAIVLLAVGLSAGTGCKRNTAADDAVPYVVTDQKSELEEQNLRAVCKATIQLIEEGPADRTTRLVELALPLSADSSLVDGLRATEPPKRMGVMRALIKKYGLAAECQPGLPAFEKGAPRPEDLPPEAPGGGTQPSEGQPQPPVQDNPGPTPPPQTAPP